jgi:hypothetical protein
MKAQSLQRDFLALGKVLDALESLDEEKRSWVLQTAASRFSVKMNPEFVPGTGPKGAGEFSAGNSNIAGSGTPTPKAFIKVKNPQTDVQRISCHGYYLTKFRENPHFKTKALTELNTEAACPKFSNPAVAVDNATKAHFLAPAGQGNKQLTGLGEELVDALPDQEKVKVLVSEHRPRKKRKKKGK